MLRSFRLLNSFSHLRRSNVLNVNRIVITCISNFTTNKDTKKDDKKIEVINDPTKSKSVLQRALSSTMDVIRNPSANLSYAWVMVKETADHYWMGTKLLWSDIKTATQILKRIAQGHGMTRRERNQLIRTTQDILRLVPFAFFVIVPFMEFLLPFALRLFPNMLPSTYQDSLKKEENLKNNLAMRFAVADFMMDTLQAMAQTKKKGESDEAASAKEVIEFMEKAKLGESLPNDTVIRMARLFKDELTLANIPRPQLVSMCQFMGLSPYGADAFLRFQLRTKLNQLKEDDRRILWEGVDSLTLQELREASQERGMRATGLNEYGYRKQLKEWIDLSMQKNIPISLLIMSRAFLLNTSLENTKLNSEQSLRNSLSSLDDDLINEVVLQHARSEELNTKEMLERKLESIQFQNELILEEREDTEDAKEYLQQKHDENVGSRLVKGGGDGRDASSADASLPGSAVAVLDISSSSSATLGSTPASSSPVSTKPSTPLLSEMQALADMAMSSSVEREKMALALMKASLEPERGAVQNDSNTPDLEDYSDLQDDSEEVTSAETSKLSSSATKPLSSTSSPLVSSKTETSSSTVTKVEAKAPKTIAYREEVSSSKVEEEEEDPTSKRMRDMLKNMIQKLEVQIDQTDQALGGKLQRLDLDRDGMLNANELKDAVVGVLKRYSSPEDAQALVAIIDKDKDGKVSVEELKEYIETVRTNIEVEAHELQMKETSPTSRK